MLIINVIGKLKFGIVDIKAGAFALPSKKRKALYRARFVGSCT